MAWLAVDSPGGAAVKRAIDIVVAGVGLVALAPLFMLIAVVVRLESRGPVFFRQVRVGRGGVPFELVKFRSMSVNASSRGPGITVQGDPRVTRVGGRLRAWKLDELPQLWNVVVGEMSLVGPRPEIPEYVNRYGAELARVLDFPPGLTDPASIVFRDEEALLAAEADPLAYYERELIPRKIELNLEYRRTATVASDMGIMLQTVAAIIRP